MGRVWNLAARRRILIGGVVGKFATVAGIRGLSDDIPLAAGLLGRS
jgi:hypothetical protein